MDLAWDLLMDPMYSNLQKAIYQNEAELRRFRQLVVNMILATDIFDKDMKSIREQRWDKAFHAYDDQCHDDGKKKDDDDVQKESSTRSIASTALNQVINLKATVVIEHLIQSSGTLYHEETEQSTISFDVLDWHWKCILTLVFFEFITVNLKRCVFDIRRQSLYAAL